MKKKRHGGIAFLTILALLICGGIGYEMIDTTVDLNSADSVSKKDKWCVELTDLSDPTILGEASSSKTDIKGTTLTFSTKFKKVDDSVSYDVYVSNCGTFDAYLYSKSLEGSDEESIDYNITGLKEGTVLKPDEKKKFSLVIKNKKDEELDLNLKIMLKFAQGE